MHSPTTSGTLPREIQTVVVGGGILGQCVAGFLAEEGREVAIIDAGRPEGTTTNAGSLHVQMQSRFMRMHPDQVPALESGLHLYPKAVAFWFELQRHLDADFGLKASGGLMVAESREQLDFLAKKAERERSLGLDSKILDRDELSQIAPYLGPAVVGAELCAAEGRLDALKANTALRRWVRRVGVMVTGETSVDRVSRDGERFKLDTSRGTVRAATLVIAAGPGSLALAEPFGLTLPVESEPLHMNITEPTDLFMGHLVQHADRMITVKQLSSGHVVIGGGWPADLSPSEDYAVVRLSSIIGNTSLAQHIVPAIGGLRIIRSWAGINTPTGGPGILGPIHGAPNAFLAIPGEAGYTLGPLSARLVADAVLGRRPTEDLAPFSPSRFR
ncbi:MAG: FAD-binding oxidoreductase [Gemmatimonadales bacterium]|nr:FAD-binding oxidoreductase [Gemmatimonadales bacterium]MBT6887072.1 FAD-binding oxidoreductase [Gemmatimonadales bacterium]